MNNENIEPMVLERYGESVAVVPVAYEYECYRNLCVDLETADTREPYTTLTTNITKLPEGQAAIDTNNHPEAIDFIKKYELGYDTGRKVKSGFCEYPVYSFYMDKLIRTFPSPGDCDR